MKLSSQTKANILGCIGGILAGLAFMAFTCMMVGCAHQHTTRTTITTTVRQMSAKDMADIQRAAAEMRGATSHIVFPPTPTSK